MSNTEHEQINQLFNALRNNIKSKVEYRQVFYIFLRITIMKDCFLGSVFRIKS